MLDAAEQKFELRFSIDGRHCDGSDAVRVSVD
jgi:hypothetical protein